MRQVNSIALRDIGDQHRGHKRVRHGLRAAQKRAQERDREEAQDLKAERHSIVCLRPIHV